MTFENCPHGLRDWKREGLGACARLGCALAKGGCTCQRKCVERVAPIFGNGLMTNALTNLPDEFQCGNILRNPQSAVN